MSLRAEYSNKIGLNMLINCYFIILEYKTQDLKLDKGKISFDASQELSNYLKAIRIVMQWKVNKNLYKIFLEFKI